MEHRSPPRIWETQSLAYQPVAANAPDEEKPLVHDPIPSQTAAFPQPLYSDERSISASPPHPSQKRSKYKGLFSGGWRTGVTYSAIAAVVVLLINVSLTLWASKKYGQDGRGLGTIFEGKCKQTKRASLWLHLTINILGTILLSASNYSMQCLSAPTRAEIDKAHRRKRWLDIGVPSVRNLGRVSRRKLVLWLLLGLSSVPLHLIYNSAVFSSLSNHSYTAYITGESELVDFPEALLGGDPTKIKILDKRACIQAYGRQFIPDRKNLVVVVSGYNSTGWALLKELRFAENGYNTGLQPFSWICDSMNFPGKSCDIKEAMARADTWTVRGGQVQYCLSEAKPEKCSLQYSLHIMIAVIICNAVKAVCMVLAVFESKDNPLVTVGDAVASFLNNEDTTTVGMCIVTMKEIKKGAWKHAEAIQGEWYPRMWKPYRAFWFTAVSRSRWVLCNILALAGMGTSLGFLCNGLKTWSDAGVPYNLQTFWDMGFGAVDLRSMFETSTSNEPETYSELVNSVLLANLPQTIFSFLYLLYNSIFTCMLLAEEWDKFSHQRQTLRVTSPTGAQRSTYFLQLPYRYSLPLIVGSGAMHWIISQSIFFVQIYDIDGTGDYSVSAVGYSPIAIILGLIMVTILLVAALANGFRRYSGGIPLAASCSAAISAACHPGPQASPAATVPVLWGVVKADSDGYAGHCSFSGEEVLPPVAGRWYSGGSSGSNLRIDSGIIRGRYGEP